TQRHHRGAARRGRHPRLPGPVGRRAGEPSPLVTGVLVGFTGDMLSHVPLRKELAAALRWAARLGFQEGVDNHFSVAVPDAHGVVTGERFLVNPYGLLWSEVTASSLVLCDGSGEIVEGEHGVESTAFFIHAPLHAHQSRAVLHTHMPYATA